MVVPMSTLGAGVSGTAVAWMERPPAGSSPVLPLRNTASAAGGCPMKASSWSSGRWRVPRPGGGDGEHPSRQVGSA